MSGNGMSPWQQMKILDILKAAGTSLDVGLEGFACSPGGFSDGCHSLQQQRILVF